MFACWIIDRISVQYSSGDCVMNILYLHPSRDSIFLYRDRDALFSSVPVSRLKQVEALPSLLT